MPGLRRGEGYLGALCIPDLSDEDDVRVVSQDAPQRLREGSCIRTHLPLADYADVVSMEVLYGVLDRDDVLAYRAVDHVYHRGQRGGLAATGGAGDQNYPAFLLGEPLDHVRQVQILQRRHLERDEAHGDGDGPPLLEGVDTEPTDSGHDVGKIRLSGALELVHLVSGDDRPQDLLGILRTQRLVTLQGGKQSLYPDHRG